MPDHLHLLVAGMHSNARLKHFMRSFRYASTLALRDRARPLWQRGYYDHVLRKSEDLNQVARYIFGNPVRAGLVRDFREYPNSGSFCFDWKEL
jgi:REP element-mobilizing transposase RayT